MICGGDGFTWQLLVFFFIFIWLQIRSENVIGILCCRDEHLSIIRVEPQLFQVVLPLMQKHKLRWDIIATRRLLRLIDLNGEVPNGQLVIGGGHGQHGVFTGLELQTGDGLGVPADPSDGIVALLVLGLVVEHAQVPDPEFSLVVS